MIDRYTDKNEWITKIELHTFSSFQVLLSDKRSLKRGSFREL
jgi:hypothetical protein